MGEKNRKEKFSGTYLTVVAIVVIVVCVGFLIDIFLGFGILMGGSLICAALWSSGMRNFFGVDENSESVVYVDTEVLRENFTIPQNLPMPYAVLNIRGSILMYNEKFAEVFPQASDASATIEMLMRQVGKEGIPVKVGERFYEAAVERCDVMEETGAIGTVLTMTMLDITEKQKIAVALEEQEATVAMIFLDNYGEVADSLDESRLPILTALIERKMNQLASDMDGMLRKLEKDRYILVLTKKYLAVLKERKFGILNEIKEVNVGEHIPVTMSIGIGTGEGSLDAASDNAKAALNLALGRGGDQAIIKDGEKFLFYGGKSDGVERNSRIRARVKANALCELIEGASYVLVMGHKNGDLDSIGSCMGISAIARGLDKKCGIVLDHVSTGIKKLQESMEIESQYGQLLIKTPEALKLMDDKTLVIVVDTHRSGMVESPRVLEAAKRIIVFDHHRKSADFIEQAVLIYHEPYASSTAELVTEIIQHIGKKIKLRTLEADALLAGITVDTKNFFVKTGAITFEAAGFLRRAGADSVRVRKLFQSDMDAYRARAVAVRDAELFQGGIAISVCPSDVEESTVVAAQAADELMNVVGIEASFVCCKIQGVIHISARSLGAINVQRIMEKLGGGGHLSVAGAQLEDMTMEEVKEKIQYAVKEYLEEEA